MKSVLKKNTLSNISRLMVFVSAIGLVAVLFFPMWRIDLDAPQYPEGLRLQIYPDKIGGDVDIINGLNHYIGMKTLHTEDFIEFTLLPYFIGGFALFCLVIALVNKRLGLSILFFSFAAFCVIAMVDFWRWEYDYGHDLNPDAAIQVPGMAYQPPLIGFKQLLNFGAYSIPDVGGWIFVGVGCLLLGAYLIEWKKLRELKNLPKVAATVLLLPLILAGCSTGPQPIEVGKDHCDFCRMTITVKQFGAEILSKKGKVLKFDDISCAAQHITSKKIDENQVSGVYVADYNAPDQLINVNDCVFFSSPDLRSPMNGNYAAFSSMEELNKTAASMSGTIVKWSDILDARR